MSFKVDRVIILCGKNEFLGEEFLPLFSVLGKPYLEWLILFLKQKGLTQFTLATGAGASRIIHHFKNGEKLGVQITYSQESVPQGVGGAIKRAVIESRGEQFLIVPVNSFYPHFIDNMFRGDLFSSLKAAWALRFFESDVPCELYELNELGNPQLNDLRSSGLKAASHYILHRDLIKKIPDGFCNAKSLHELLIDEGVTPLILGGKIYNFQNPADYTLFQENVLSGCDFKATPALFLDRDGVMIEDKHYLKSPEEVNFFPYIYDIIQWGKDNNYKVICLTNQSGVAKGYFTTDDVEVVTQFIKDRLQRKGVPLDDTYYCLELNSFFRKPNPGMALKASQEHNIDLTQSIMVGDKPSDELLNLSLKTFLLKSEYYLAESLELSSNVQVVEDHKALLVALRKISILKKTKESS